MKLHSKLILALLSFSLLPTSVLLAAGPPPPPPGNPTCWPPPCIPIDGGVSFLIIAGLALGALKIYSSYKSKTA